MTFYNRPKSISVKKIKNNAEFLKENQTLRSSLATNINKNTTMEKSKIRLRINLCKSVNNKIVYENQNVDYDT